MEVMLVNNHFITDARKFKPGEVYLTSAKTRATLEEQFKILALKNNNFSIEKSIKFIDLDDHIDRATKEGKFKNLLIIRSGGIGDLIALSSIIDYFDDCNIHFLTQKKYFPLFKWFTRPVKLYHFADPIFTDFSSKTLITKYNTWARLHAEGLIEKGDERNWMELFFEFIGEDNPPKVFLRPDLHYHRISDEPSNISRITHGKSILICNKSTAMMRTCHAADIIEALPVHVKSSYKIFVYLESLSSHDLSVLPKLESSNIHIIGKTNLDRFLLDCFDCTHLISVDTGAIHFREGIGQKGIGIYNSFTTESRTKHYTYTKSFDIRSACELQPCFMHETTSNHFCIKGNADSFAAPCIDNKFNKTFIKQLRDIFNEYDF